VSGLREREQFSLIRARLGTHASFEVNERREFVWPSGRRPADLFRDLVELRHKYGAGDPEACPPEGKAPETVPAQ
jgi:hypothetical protein